MSGTTPHADPPRPKARLPFVQRPLTPGGTLLRRAGVAVHTALCLGLAGLAAYMNLVDGHALQSPYVVAPAVGAIWFALRLFMRLAPR